MRRSSFILGLVFSTLVCAAASQAQWVQTGSPNFASPNPAAGGAMVYNSGILWAGGSSLWRSTDIGTSWTKTSFPAVTIYDIYFVSPNLGVVSTSDNGLYLTTDAGATWQNPLHTVAFYAIASSSLDTILVSQRDYLNRSTDRGKTWKPISNLYGVGILNEHEGMIYYLDSASLAISTDWGATWTKKPGKADLDCWSMAFEPCNRLVYLMNDDYWRTNDDVGSVYVTGDFGEHWYPRGNHGPPSAQYYCGNIVATDRAVYAQTISNGIVRSVDEGNSWRSIGGPMGAPDQKLLLVIEDTIFAADTKGDLWRTTDFTLPTRSGVRTMPAIDTLFSDVRLQPCEGTVVRTITIERLCDAPDLLDEELQGADTSFYHLIDVGKTQDGLRDSVTIEFLPDNARRYGATITLHYTKGVSLRIALGGERILPHLPQSIGATLPLFVRDSVSNCGTPLARGLALHDPCKYYHLDSLAIVGADSATYSLIDSSHRAADGVDSLTLAFHPTEHWLHHADLLMYYGKDTVRIPLSGYGLGDPLPVLLTKVDTLFSAIRISPCDPKAAFQTIYLRDTCATTHFDFAEIIGKNLSSYAISFAGNDPTNGTDSVTVAFLPDSERVCDATLRLHYGRAYLDIPMQGRGLPIAPPELLTAFDTLFRGLITSACDTIAEQKIVLRDTCASTRLVSARILGADSLSYLVNISHDPTQTTDTFTVSFVPAKNATMQAILELQYPSGYILRIPMTGTGRTRPGQLILSEQPIFLHDSLAYCNPPQIRQFVVYDSCASRTLDSAWVGALDSASYSVMRRASNGNYDTIDIAFHPTALRAYHGTLFVKFNDRTIQVPLAGTAVPAPQVRVASSRVAPLGIIGETLELPIIVQTTGSVAAMGMRMTYDTSILIYQDVIGNDGSQAFAKQASDTTLAVQWDMSARSSMNDTIGYARFLWFPTTLADTRVAIDSITTTAAPNECLSLLDSTASITIDGSSTCNTPLLSHWLRYRTPITFHIQPNPAANTATIVTDYPTDYAITVRDVMGRERIARVSHGGGLTLDVSPLPQGVYFVQFSANGREMRRQLLIQR